MTKSKYIVIAVFIFLTSCSTDDEARCIGNLKDKSLSHVKNCIYGKWKLDHTSGGFAGRTFYYDSTFIEFKRTDSIFWTTNGKVFLNNSIEWQYREDITGDMNHIMIIKIKTFSDGHEVYEHIAVDRIDPDFLIIFSDGADGFIYHLERN